jgi:ribokinase
MQKGVGIVIVTLGANGALVVTREFAKHMPGFKVKAVDTTAAGDTFNGALATALSEGRTLLDAVCFAGAAAAISVTRAGAQPSVPKRHGIDALLAQYR